MHKGPQVAAPADRNRGRAESIFKNQVPADDPGHQFAQRRIRIGICATGYRNHRSELGVTQASKRARRAGKNERNDDGRAGKLRSRLSGDHENSGADDCAYSESYKIEWSQSSPQTVLASLLRLAH